jgi:ornithine cyclodeaminase
VPDLPTDTLRRRPPHPPRQLCRVSIFYLSEPDMIRAGVTDMPACVDAMEEMFHLLHHGDYRMAGGNNNQHGAVIVFPEDSPFPAMPKPTTDRRFMAMPAYLGGRFGTAGMKWYGSNVANRDKGLPRSILTFVLNDADTGAPLATCRPTCSAYRTGAIPGVGARHLARPDSRVVGIVGPGVMARTRSRRSWLPARQSTRSRSRGAARPTWRHSAPGPRRASRSFRCVWSPLDEEVA